MGYIFIITSLVVIVLLNVSGGQMIYKEDCLYQCSIYANQQTSDPTFQQIIWKNCASTCSSLPSRATTTTAAPSTAAPTASNQQCILICKDTRAYLANNWPFSDSYLDNYFRTCMDRCNKTNYVSVEVRLDDCRFRCDNQYRNLKADPNHDVELVTRTKLECHRSCYTAVLPRDNRCDQWVSSLAGLYAKEQTKAFVDTLKVRATQTCNTTAP